MTQVKVTPQTREQIAKLYTDNGKSNKLITMGESSNVPEKVTFGNVYFQENKENPNFGHFRIECYDEKGTKTSCSASKLHVLGLKKTSPETSLTPANLILRTIKNGDLKGKKTYMVNGAPLNKVMAMSEPDTLLSLQGKTFKAVKAERFNVPFEVWESKDQAIDAANIASYFELSEI